MKPEALVKKDGKPTHAVMCGACGQVYAHGPMSQWTDLVMAQEAAESLAEDCCTLIVCSGGCGKKLGLKNKGGMTKCQDCRRRDDRVAELKKANSNKVTRYTPDSAPKGVLVYAHGDDKFFDDADEFMAVAEDCDWSPGDFPVVLWLCAASKPQLDADSVLENFEDNLELGEDTKAENVCKDIDGLVAAIEAFNSKQTESIWHPRGDACVLVTAADIGIEFCAKCAGTGESPVANPETDNPVCDGCGGTGRENPDGP